MGVVSDTGNDPVRAKRARIQRYVSLGKRVGYGGLLAAIAAFVIGVIASFPPWTVAVATSGLVVCCVALPPAVVFGYAVRAAEREDRERF
jgi:hypothetical protein